MISYVSMYLHMCVYVHTQDIYKQTKPSKINNSVSHEFTFILVIKYNFKLYIVT